MIIDSISVNDTTKEPDCQGNASELVGTTQIIKDKVVSSGCRFSSKM